MGASMVAEAWVSAVVALGGRAEPAHDVAIDLLRRYAEPQRSYHTAAHVDSVVRDCRLLGAAEGLDDSDQAIVALAACAHDVVYDARPGVDERASAAWARAALTGCGVAAPAVERVADIVLATITHTAAPDDRLTAVLLDADLAVLGGTPDDYARYVAAVREEYAAVSDEDWRVGRFRILAALAGRELLYSTASARARWEATARFNLDAELAGLGGG